MMIQYAGHVLGFVDALDAEYDPYASNFVVSELQFSLADRQMVLQFVAGSRVADLHGALSATEECYGNFGVNPIPGFASGALRIVV